MKALKMCFLSNQRCCILAKALLPETGQRCLCARRALGFNKIWQFVNLGVQGKMSQGFACSNHRNDLVERGPLLGMILLEPAPVMR